MSHEEEGFFREVWARLDFEMAFLLVNKERENLAASIERTSSTLVEMKDAGGNLGVTHPITPADWFEGVMSYFRRGGRDVQFCSDCFFANLPQWTREIHEGRLDVRDREAFDAVVRRINAHAATDEKAQILQAVSKTSLPIYSKKIAEILNSEAGSEFAIKLGRRLYDLNRTATQEPEPCLDRLDRWICDYWNLSPIYQEEAETYGGSLSHPLKLWEPESAAAFYFFRTGEQIQGSGFQTRRKKLGLKAPKKKLVRGVVCLIQGKNRRLVIGSNSHRTAIRTS
jgi:hypothetical protein